MEISEHYPLERNDVGDPRQASYI